MARQPEINAIPDIGELGMMIGFLRLQRDARQEAERLAEILELEAAHQRLAALLEGPAFGSVHRDSPVLQRSRSLKRHSMTSSSRCPFAFALPSRARGHARVRRMMNFVNFRMLEMPRLQAQLAGKGVN